MTIVIRCTCHVRVRISAEPAWKIVAHCRVPKNIEIIESFGPLVKQLSTYHPSKVVVWGIRLKEIFISDHNGVNT